MLSISDLINALRSIVLVAADVKRQDEEIKAIRTELRDLTIIVHALAHDIKNSKERSEQRHENLLLEIENRLLKFERALPAAKASNKATKKGGKR